MIPTPRKYRKREPAGAAGDALAGTVTLPGPRSRTYPSSAGPRTAGRPVDIAVLVKVVPPLDDLRFDPVRRTVVREGEGLYLNPFDQRALRVALDLRRAGETVSAVSLGPPDSRGPLRDACALGIDRTLLVSDPRCAGSDTLATSVCLAGALGRVGHELVLAGAWTTDSETGQVGPEVAALLGVPVLSGARAITRGGAASELDVTVDTPTGWARYRVRAPVVISVGEKIAKPTKVAPEERARVRDEEVEVVGLDEISVPAHRVGLAGSPTVVRWVEDDRPTRTPVLVSDGTPAERVARALRSLAPLLRRPTRPRAVGTFAPDSETAGPEVLILVTDATGALEEAALPLLSEVRRSLPGYRPTAVWLGASPAAPATARLARAGARAGLRMELEVLPTDSRTAATALGVALDVRPQAAAGMTLSDPFGRETAGQLAARRSLGLTGDAIGVRSDAPGEIVWTKPSFGAGAIAGIVSRTRPSLATVRPGAWEEGTASTSDAEWHWTPVRPPAFPPPLVPVESGAEVAPSTPTLEQRDVVVAVGMGVGGPEGVAAIAPLVARWGAALGATRRVVDAGWVPRQFQIGLTGRSPAPRLGVLLGVSGSPNHLVGWRRARALLAVNRDPTAPVFRDVDVGIVAPLEDVVPLLGDALAALLGR